jgi:hypothetical protein
MSSRFFDDTLVQIVRQLGMMSPLLLVYAAGIFLGFMSLEKHRRSAVLLIAGTGILLVSTAGFPFVFHAVMSANHNRPDGGPSVAGILTALSLLNTLVHAVGVGLLIAAALVDRKYEPAES